MNNLVTPPLSVYYNFVHCSQTLGVNDLFHSVKKTQANTSFGLAMAGTKQVTGWPHRMRKACVVLCW
jgi:hypothetical protein